MVSDAGASHFHEWRTLRLPGAGSAQVFEDILGDDGVFSDLEVEHPDAGEIGAVLE